MCVPRLSSWATSLRHLYCSPISSLCHLYHVQQQQYADDTQLYIAVLISDPRNELNALQTCLTSLQTWFCTNGMALNPDTYSAILLGTAYRASSYSSLTSVDVAGTPVQCWYRTLNFSALLLIPILQCGSIPSVSLSHVLPYPCISPHTCCLRQVHRSRHRRSFGFQSTTWLRRLSSLRLAVEVLDTVARIVLQQPSLSSWDTLQQLHWLLSNGRYCLSRLPLPTKSYHWYSVISVWNVDQCEGCTS